MMTQVKNQLDKVKNNVVGVAAGAAAGYAVVHFGKSKMPILSKTWVKMSVIVIGALVGANVQSKRKAVKSVPSASTVKK